jgi:hypothetical protein
VSERRAVLVRHGVEQPERIGRPLGVRWVLVEGEVVPPYCAGEGARGDGPFGRVEDVGGGARGALGGGGFAVDGAKEDGGPFEGGVSAGGEGLDARWRGS